MTQTLTTEQLKNLSYSGGIVGDLARELLANREAQPVGFYTTVSGRKGVIWHNGAPEDDTAIYTAPPAPAVPDERAAFNAWNNEDNLPIAGVPAKNAAWLAWQARAMLAQPVSSGYKLPPHSYRELVNSLRDTAVKYSGTDQLRERLNTALSQFIEPDHPHTRTTELDRN